MNLKRLSLIWAATLFVVVGIETGRAGADTHRFFYEGDGCIHLKGEKSEQSFSGRYRSTAGHYDETAYQRICWVFGAACQSPDTAISLRLVAFLDFLADRLNATGPITITSGYRSPVYNTKLRQSGSLAAKASLHQYGMAADLKMAGVSSRRIWRYVQKLGFGGTGYYHGETVHVDVGPARSWDETTSGVGTGLADDNRLIGLVADYDRYPPGAWVTLRFIRMTAFPIGVVPEFVLKRIQSTKRSTEALRFKPRFAVPIPGRCPHLTDIVQLGDIQWRLPGKLPPGRYTISARFCDKSWEKMPGQVATPVFEIVKP